MKRTHRTESSCTLDTARCRQHPCAHSDSRVPTFLGTVSKSVSAKGVSDFYVGPPVDRGGVPLRIDLIIVYDPAQLEGIQIPFHGDERPPYSAARFKYPDRRQDAVRGLLKIL
jgi:hypothetical protein